MWTGVVSLHHLKKKTTVKVFAMKSKVFFFMVLTHEDLS